LDPKYRIIEMVSLGTHVKNTKRFYVLNPTSEAIQFEWRHVPAKGEVGEDDAFRCMSKHGEIRPDKKFEMIFEFAPLTTETRESFWKFLLLGQKIEEHFLIVGQVEEPRVGMDSPAINFGERLLDGETSEKVRLVNKEIIPFSFNFDPASYLQEGQPQVISVFPTSGVIGPDSTQDVEVTFKPIFERAFNFNLLQCEAQKGAGCSQCQGYWLQDSCFFGCNGIRNLRTSGFELRRFRVSRLWYLASARESVLQVVLAQR